MRNLIKVWQPEDLTQIELQRGLSVNRPVPRHWHEEYQFCLVENGMGDLTYRGRDYLTPPASLFIVHPGEVHSNRAFDRQGCSFRTIFLAPELVRNIASQIQPKEKGFPFFPSTMIFDRNTIRQFFILHHSFEQPSSSLEREVLLQEFLVKLTTCFAENPITPTSLMVRQKEVRQAYDYLIANYTENVSLEKLAGMNNMSPFHFNRTFSKHVGMPPHAFQVQLRVSQAKRLLGKGLDIAQAASQSGFSDQSHLTRHFKRIIGITPGEYRRK